MNTQYWPDIASYLKKVDAEKEAFTSRSISVDIVEEKRKSIEKHLKDLQETIEKSLDKQHTSLVLFALIALIDEEIQRSLLNVQNLSWLPLQKDFFGAFNAGEMFYKNIDGILDDSSIPTIVFEAFYFALKRGFLGRYRDSKTQITKYLQMLAEKLPVQEVTPEPAPLVDIKPQSNMRFKPWHYYSLAAGTFVIAYLTLFLCSL